MVRACILDLEEKSGMFSCYVLLDILINSNISISNTTGNLIIVYVDINCTLHQN